MTMKDEREKLIEELNEKFSHIDKSYEEFYEIIDFILADRKRIVYPLVERIKVLDMIKKSAREFVIDASGSWDTYQGEFILLKCREDDETLKRAGL